MRKYCVDETLLQQILTFIATARTDKPVGETVKLVDTIRHLQPMKEEENTSGE